MKNLIISLFVILSGNMLFAQDGQYDYRFVDVPSQDPTIALVEIEIKASAAENAFYISNQNYRFTFNDMAVNPYTADQPTVSIDQELELSGVKGQSFYQPHNLEGSSGNIISYNVDLAGGEGFLVTADKWVKIGRLAFELANQNADLDLQWRQAGDFPYTIILEKNAGIETQTEAGTNFIFNDLAIQPAINTPMENEMLVKPSLLPANGDITVSLNLSEAKEGTLVLIDATGKTLKEYSLEGNNNEVIAKIVKTDGLVAGTYWIQFVAQNWQSDTKAVVLY